MSQVVCSKPVLIHWVIGDCLLTLVQTCAYAAGKNISNQCKNVKQDVYISVFTEHATSGCFRSVVTN